MKDQADDKRSPIIAGALILTLAFLGLFGGLLVNTVLPAECPAGLWLVDRLSCLSPNELGDAFAGAFAPVAFVWLVAAVMLQRDELAAQRQELRESRAVAAEQVEEARKNVGLISQQTDMLRDQDSEVRQRRNEETIDHYLELVADIFSRASGRVVIYFEYRNNGGSNHFSFDPRGGSSAHHYVKHCIAKFDNHTKDIEVENLLSAQASYSSDLQDIDTALHAMDVLSLAVGDVKQLQIRNLQASRFRIAHSRYLNIRSAHGSSSQEVD